jgi:hypothetical protein
MFHTGNTRVIERLTREGSTLTLRADDEIEEAAFCDDRDMPREQDLSSHRSVR